MSTPCVFGPVTPFALLEPPPHPTAVAATAAVSSPTAMRVIGPPSFVVPAPRSGRASALAPVHVREPHHVVKLGRRDLQDLAVLDRLDGMHLAGQVPPRLAR